MALSEIIAWGSDEFLRLGDPYCVVYGVIMTSWPSLPRSQTTLPKTSIFLFPKDGQPPLFPPTDIMTIFSSLQ